MKTFREICDSHDCDKTTYHAYDQVYPLFLEPRRQDPLRLLEIGVDEGKSLSVWREYLPAATIIAADILDKQGLGADEFHQVDQSSERDLRALADRVAPLDVIIDDGSHLVPHQVLTFEVLFSTALAPGGVYVIEDVECSYWAAGSPLYGYLTGGETIFDYFRDVHDVVNAHFSRRSNERALRSVSFFQNAIVIQKQTLEDQAKAQRPYRFAGFLPG